MHVQYITRNIRTVFALLCFVMVIHWLIFPYPSGLLHWHCGNLMIVPVPAKQPWWVWINTSCELIMNDCITTNKQSTTQPCAYFLGYPVIQHGDHHAMVIQCSFWEYSKVQFLVTHPANVETDSECWMIPHHPNQCLTSRHLERPFLQT